MSSLFPSNSSTTVNVTPSLLARICADLVFQSRDSPASGWPQLMIWYSLIVFSLPRSSVRYGRAAVEHHLLLEILPSIAYCGPSDPVVYDEAVAFTPSEESAMLSLIYAWL